MTIFVWHLLPYLKYPPDAWQIDIFYKLNSLTAEDSQPEMINIIIRTRIAPKMTKNGTACMTQLNVIIE